MSAAAAGPSFAWSPEEFRRVGYRAVDLLAEYLAALPQQPTFLPVPADRADALRAAALPASGTPVDELLDDLVHDVAPFPFGNGHPRFFGWVNSPPAQIAIIAELLAAGLNPSVAGGNHAAVYVEHAVINWFKELFGFPDSSMGLLVSGGSMAAVTALAVARHSAYARAGRAVRREGMQGASVPLVVYKSAEAHSCHQKAIELLGIGTAHMRTIPADTSLRIRPAELDAMVRADIDAGLLPMAVIASAGTVNTGAIDPISEIADVCHAHNVWLHIDGAYGAPAIVSERYRDSLAAVARADSLAVDPHKWMYVPVEAGFVLIRNAHAMRETFSVVPPYLRTDGNERGIQGPPWFSEFGVQQTRGFLALKVWLSMRYFGVGGYRALIEHDLSLAEYLAGRIRELPDFELREPTSLSVVCFRFARPQHRHDEASITSENKRMLEQLQLGGEAFVSSTVLDGQFWMRACIVNPLADKEDVDHLLAALGTISQREFK